MKEEPEDSIQTRWTLIARLKDLDDQESWRVFFDTYGGLIYGVAIKSGLSHAEAQDVVQETVISVSKNMKSFKADPAVGSFKSWLLTLTRWRIVDQFRRRGRELHPSPAASPQSETRFEETSFEARIADPAANVLDRIWEEEWERHVIAAALEKVKQQVSARHYQVFYVLAIKQVPPAKVAATLGLPVDQVYLIKHRLTKIFETAIKAVETRVG